MKTVVAAAVAAALLAGIGTAQAEHSDHAMIVTSSNTAANQLLFFDTNGTLLKSVPTDGQGGVGGNAGGIAASHDRVAVVNFGSGNVTVFRHNTEDAFYHVERIVQSLGSPVSVAFGHDHLYILTTTDVESHRVDRNGVEAVADGAAPLLHADGSAAQVGVLDDQVIVTEKSNAIETANLSDGGAIRSGVSSVANIPANVNAPFGLATRGSEAYVTIAHANEISLVRRDTVVTVTGSGTQSAPCWVALDGPFLFSANSPSKSVSRYAVHGRQLTQEVAVAASFAGNPTDIAYRSGLAAVVDSDGTVSHVSVFGVDEDGNLTLRGVGTLNSKTTNGIAIIDAGDLR